MHLRLEIMIIYKQVILGDNRFQNPTNGLPSKIFFKLLSRHLQFMLPRVWKY